MNASNETPLSQHSHALGTALKKLFAVLLAISGIGFILWLDSWFMQHADMPKLNSQMNYGLLFLVGFLTSFHCVGMCGPLIVGYTAKHAVSGIKSYSTHLLYGMGKTLSYSLIGGLFGAFGSIIAFTPTTQGMVGLAAGAFLILFGLHMLNVFPALSHFEFKPPLFLMRFIGKEYRKHHSPFMIGMLNGLMIICGPLQAMYVMAAGSGSWSTGATILFFFGVGTLPLLLGFGFLASLLSANLTPKLLKASGVIVIILGSVMLNRGLAVTASGMDFNTLVARVSQKLSPTVAEPLACDTEQNITMNVLSSSYEPNRFTLRKGIPVKWHIDVKELNECNKEIVVNDYGLKIKLHEGEQIVQFTPQKTGIVPWSCWMGMIPGTFIVVENETALKPNSASQQSTLQTIQGYQQRVLKKIKQLWQQLDFS